MEGAVSFTVARFLDVSQGVQENQFTVGSREEKKSLEELDPVYRQLLDKPVTAVIAVMGGDGRPWLTPVWFNYEGGKVLLNTAEREIHEDDPTHGQRAVDTIDQAWTKYSGNQPPYGLRDPGMNERRVLFECRVDRVATFGQP